MSNNFTEQGIAVVKEAIQADNEQDYAKAHVVQGGIEVLSLDRRQNTKKTRPRNR